MSKDDRFEKLYRGYYKKLVRSFLSKGCPPEDARELAQETLLRVYRSMDRFRDESSLATWMFTIARNLCLNEIRRRSRHPADSLESSQSDHDEHPGRQYEDFRVFSPPDNLLQGELEQKVEEALAELPENQRAAILLCRGEELSYEEIAKVLGCSLSATKSLIHRGRETLKQKLKPYLRSGIWTRSE